MEESQAVYLFLHSPLCYTKTLELLPFSHSIPENDKSQELLFCFELNGEQANRIDPEPDCFLGKLVFAGKGEGKANAGNEISVQLPAGKYLFLQQRKVLDKDECVALAVEQQKDGLWERAQLKNLLYIRYLFEDGSPVTQVIRPII